MAGIYIHIPFCKTKCHYCDFYKSTDFVAKSDFLNALKKEIIQRCHELEDEPVQSIYFGGGTPSVLKIEEIADILEVLRTNFQWDDDTEITMEANPDDLTKTFLNDIRGTAINRLSVGIQSFNDDDLKGMNRRHNSSQAVHCIEDAREAGFDNISLDLIYGLPGQSLADWQLNIQKVISLQVRHISAYHLTYHKGTVFYDYLKSGKLKELPDELSFGQFKLLKDMLEGAGFEHYEISNFAVHGSYSRHNCAYWQRRSYLGFGPSAHSFDLKTRRWNVASLGRYLKSIEQGLPYSEKEVLKPQDQYNDYMITSLRTIWGISKNELRNNFDPVYGTYFEQEAKPFLESGHMFFQNGIYRLTAEGLFISDKIMEDLLYI